MQSFAQCVPKPHLYFLALPMLAATGQKKATNLQSHGRTDASCSQQCSNFAFLAPKSFESKKESTPELETQRKSSKFECAFA